MATQSTPHLSAALVGEMEAHGKKLAVPKGTTLVRQEQYIKELPMVTSGTVEVYTQFDTKDLLLYYIEPTQSCVMSFAAGLYERPSRIFAKAATEAELLLLPMDRVRDWLAQYPSFAQWMYQQYDQRYADLLETIEQVLLKRMDERLEKFLAEKSRLTGSKLVAMSHGEIAYALGTAREVVSRVLKKLEQDGRIKQAGKTIEVLAAD